MPIEPQSGAAPAADSVDNLGDDLRSAFAAAEAGTTAPAPDAATVTPTDAASKAAGHPAASAKTEAGQARDAAGKFAIKPGDPAAPATAAAPAAAPADGKALAPGTAAAPAPIEPLQHWPEEQKALIRNLAVLNPEMAQAAFARFKAVDDEFSKRSQQFKPLRELQESLEPLLAKGRQQRMMRGVDDRTYMQSIMAAADFLEQNPVDGLMHLAQQYGINFAQLAQQAAAAPQVDPYIRQLEQEVAQLKQGFTGMQQHTQKEQELALLAQVQSFADAKDANGQALRPHFNTVLGDIELIVAAQLKRGETPDLQAAYDKAIRMSDTVSQQLQSETKAREAAAAEEKRKQEIADAKRAGFSVTGSGADLSNQPADTLRGELARQFDRYAA